MENVVEKKEKFLPIGTVVMLKGGRKPVMITSFCVLPLGKIYDQHGEVDKRKVHYFDYGAVFYPEGFLRSDRSFVFNHEQIDKVLFQGYLSENHNEYSEDLNKMMNEFQGQFKQADIEIDKRTVNFGTLNI